MRSATYYGRLILSKEDAFIDSIKLPNITDKFVTIDREDLFYNAASFLSSDFPVFYEETAYKGQPILAIFSSDIEAVTIAEKECQISYSKIEGNDESFILPKATEYSFGKFPDEELEYKKITTKYVSKELINKNNDILTTSSWIEDDKIYVETSTQWPESIKAAISRCLNIERSNIVVLPSQYYLVGNQYLLWPVISSVIAAAASLKADITVELTVPLKIHNIKSEITRTTYVDPDNEIVAEEVVANLDVGKYTILEDETKRQAIAGLIPNYNLKYFKASVTLHNSNTSPATLYPGLSYTDALASTALQYNEIATYLNVNPISFRENFTARASNKYLDQLSLKRLCEIMQKIADKSNFHRKWYSYAMQKGNTSLMPYYRAIGSAAFPTISGFSKSEAQKYEFKAKLTKINNTVILNTSFFVRPKASSLIKKLFTKEIGPHIELIILDNDNNSVDSGPDFLSRSHGRFPTRIIEACKQMIEENMESIIFDIDDKNIKVEYRLQSLSSIIVELVIDEITYDVEAKNVYYIADLGIIIERGELESSIKHEILATLVSLGVKCLNCNIIVELVSDTTKIIEDFRYPIKGLVTSGVLNALKLAFPKIEYKVPITSLQIINAIRNGNYEN